MPRFGTLPPDVPVDRRLEMLAPAFAVRVRKVLATLDGGRAEWPFETLRTEARQTFLYGFGRDYDDGRGIVTRATSALYSWHGFGLALDIVEKDATPWVAPSTFWNAIGDAAEKFGLVWAGRWHATDLPHVQWGACPVSPTEEDRMLFRTQGMKAVWTKYGAAA